MNDTTTTAAPSERKEFAYQPLVTYGEPDFVEEMGPYLIALYAKEIQSHGFMSYLRIARVVDEQMNDCFFVAAETGPADQGAIFLGTFTADRHSTILRSPLLDIQTVFFLTARELTRKALGLSKEQAPLNEKVNQGLIQRLPGVIELTHKVQPNWKTDEDSVRLLDLIIDSVKAEHPDLREQLYKKAPGKLSQLLKWKR